MMLPKLVSSAARSLRLAAFGADVQGVFGFLRQFGRIFTKNTAFSAKGTAKSLMAIPAQYIRAAVTGDAFGFRIEKKDAPVHVMGNNPFFKVIQDIFQVVPVAHQIF
jgi:hypothetical protein